MAEEKKRGFQALEERIHQMEEEHPKDQPASPGKQPGEEARRAEQGQDSPERTRKK